MTAEEVKKAFDDLKSEGMDDNAILVALGKMFQNGDVTKDQLGALIHQLGYEFTPEFAEKSEEDSKSSVLGTSEGDDKPKEGEDPDNSAEEGDDGYDTEEEEDEDDDEEEERRKAMSLFGR